MMRIEKLSNDTLPVIFSSRCRSDSFVVVVALSLTPHFSPSTHVTYSRLARSSHSPPPPRARALRRYALCGREPQLPPPLAAGSPNGSATDVSSSCHPSGRARGSLARLDPLAFPGTFRFPSPRRARARGRGGSRSRPRRSSSSKKISLLTLSLALAAFVPELVRGK